jgi:membrane protein implicated in regulation of membrane protease activity
MEIWAIWWVWVVAGVVLGVLEIMVPGFVFLGFAIGAGLTGVLVGLGLAPGNVALLALVFAVLSLVSWLVLRRAVGVTKTQVKVWKDDINEN